MTTGEGPRRGRGRPRTPGAEERILDAALAEYGEHGWSGFTMDAVARRAGVGKSTVYLRWSDKDALLTDAVASHGLELTAVDTGSLAGDLTQLALNLLRHFHGAAGWAALRITFDTASVDDRLGDFAEAVNEVHGRQVEQICLRAIERGEMAEDIPITAVTETIYGAAMVHALSERLEARADSDVEVEARARHIVAMILPGISTMPGTT
ncbi:TetR family transcriptional regulator [Nocardioides sp. LMS-CY]|uniref:AcrR family transcriptional regulator n=1 Tax=Nocardioides soli TaxID=1036020 RepID=A0A7W4VV46_9ACTN|nr:MULTISPECIES: TetR/AcrR family transcriptional regulator [Nocardioides]MBB3042210.1 AcrR family transcriptional regulator [Nocardioides soli]QWF21682.1 TetR family transcriptional regulator [Nocardioides sp. LMS-CY]